MRDSKWNDMIDVSPWLAAELASIVKLGSYSFLVLLMLAIACVGTLDIVS